MASFKGLYTAIYRTTDLDQAKRWYTDVLDTPPYFDQPFYVGFNVGGFELGLLPPEDGLPTGAGGVSVYWGVDSMTDAWARLTGHGAVPVEEPHDVGGGIQVAMARDPFGNLLGVIENPHFPNQA